VTLRDEIETNVYQLEQRAPHVRDPRGARAILGDVLALMDMVAHGSDEWTRLAKIGAAMLRHLAWSAESKSR